MQEMIEGMKLKEGTRDAAATENDSVEPPITLLDKSKRTSTTISSGSDSSRREVRFDPKVQRGGKEEYIKTPENKRPSTSRIVMSLSRDKEAKDIVEAAKKGDK